MHDAQIVAEHDKEHVASAADARHDYLHRSLPRRVEFYESCMEHAFALDAELDKLDELPFDSCRKSVVYYEGRRRVRVEKDPVPKRCVHLSEYTRLLKAANEHAKFAIVGLYELANEVCPCDLTSSPSFNSNLNDSTTERLPGEPARAFRAYCVYRDLGPRRTIAQAWAKEHKTGHGSEIGNAEQPPARCQPTGHWGALAKRWNWVARAVAHDAKVAAALYGKQSDLQLQISGKYLEFDQRNQDRLERRIDKVEALYKRALRAPTHAIRTKTTTPDGPGKTVVTEIRVNAVSPPATLAAFQQQFRDTMRQGVVGVLGKPSNKQPIWQSTKTSPEPRWLYDLLKNLQSDGG